MSVNLSEETECRTNLFINGRSVDTGNWTGVADPAAPETIVGYAAAATNDHSIAAVDAADAAFTGWSMTPVRERVALVRGAIAVLEDHSQTLTELLVRENGKIAQEAAIDLAVFGGRCRAACELGEQLIEPVYLAAPPFRTEIHRLPVGVVSIIVPFNWPLAILAASLPYALVAGNTVIVKPPPTAPLTVVRTLEMFAARLPEGVVNIVTGDNHAVEPLIRDPRVQHVVFTGSTAAGSRIMTMAAQSLTKVTLELGGNDPAIVLGGADLDMSTLNDLAAACFLTTGQVCMGVKRIYVARDRFDELVDGMGRVLDTYIVGDGLDSRVTMGPLHTATQRASVLDLIAQARRAGTEIREFGSMTDRARRSAGHYLLPSLALDPDPDLDIVTQEQFGPTVPILPFDDLDTLVENLNSEWSGLCSSVWTRDEDRGGDIARRLRTGTTWINQANAGACDDRAPFGGFRRSGIGREMGTDGLLDFTEPHTVTFRA
ncbi:aldehyde dehydrogenase family protein [Nocardia fusca]|uniref:aldehyde dehydrogenase family protein n=1 Tax=Nocardia fusca TaxID=941183 RepID=UPI0037AD41B6